MCREVAAAGHGRIDFVVVVVVAVVAREWERVDVAVEGCGLEVRH